MNDFLIQQQDNFDDSEYELEQGEMCPNAYCTGKLIKEAIDKYSFVYICNKCEDTWS